MLRLMKRYFADKSTPKPSPVKGKASPATLSSLKSKASPVESQRKRPLQESLDVKMGDNMSMTGRAQQADPAAKGGLCKQAYLGFHGCCICLSMQTGILLPLCQT